ncbi:amidase domain-containing protein [Paenactinomyces guangxiensis]|uniref:Amidase domain-containing protein n=1 Tax=Paenactinomyces guangxiensis TaxID=1490290 RepID=A0A7W1WPM5_9BACL|nr:amidase domain-containing protein [Paenactinomyces guangxiensis]MBA4493695.1 amidase domain-containing protein [Paenactinomyces guangxiensis]MBH8590982.1 amidase domain-containing protein [Paenactinomyces guangxiensis]
MKRVVLILLMLCVVAVGCQSNPKQASEPAKEKPADQAPTAEVTEPEVKSLEDSTYQISAQQSSKKSDMNKQLLKQVTYYKEVKETPKADKKPEQKDENKNENNNATTNEDKFKDIIKLIQKIAKKERVNITPDINNADYRNFVLYAATDLGSLSKEEAKLLAEYAKYIDSYENKAKNSKIKIFVNRLKAGAPLTAEEKLQLLSLLPVKEGTKLKKGPTNPKAPGNSEKPSDSDKNNNKPPTGGEEEPPADQPKDKPKQDDDKPKAGEYDRIAARDYAYKWWNARNNEEYGYYSRVSGGCYNCWPDCTNFVSQAIKAGGILEKREGTFWYYSDKKPSYAWGVANSFYNHFKDRAKQAKSFKELQVGDVVNVDFDHDGDIEHSAIITKIDKFDVYVTQHSTDKKNSPLSSWILAGYDVYAWKMDTANDNVKAK